MNHLKSRISFQPCQSDIAEPDHLAQSSRHHRRRRQFTKCSDPGRTRAALHFRGHGATPRSTTAHVASDAPHCGNRPRRVFGEAVASILDTATF